MMQASPSHNTFILSRAKKPTTRCASTASWLPVARLRRRCFFRLAIRKQAEQIRLTLSFTISNNRRPPPPREAASSTFELSCVADHPSYALNDQATLLIV